MGSYHRSRDINRVELVASMVCMLVLIENNAALPDADNLVLNLVANLVTNLVTFG